MSNRLAGSSVYANMRRNRLNLRRKSTTQISHSAKSPGLIILSRSCILYSGIANIKCTVVIKAQDILVLLKLVAQRDQPWTYSQLAAELDLSSSQVHAAVRRIIRAGLALEESGRVQVHTRNVEEFMLHALRYISVPERGPKSRGMATLASAPPLASLFLDDEEPIVWPDPSGDSRGESLEPIYKSAPAAARRDPELYELLVIGDALRAGRARERQAAAKELKKKLRMYG